MAKKFNILEVIDCNRDKKLHGRFSAETESKNPHVLIRRIIELGIKYDARHDHDPSCAGIAYLGPKTTDPEFDNIEFINAVRRYMNHRYLNQDEVMMFKVFQWIASQVDDFLKIRSISLGDWETITLKSKHDGFTTYIQRMSKGPSQGKLVTSKDGHRVEIDIADPNSSRIIRDVIIEQYNSYLIANIIKFATGNEMSWDDMNAILINQIKPNSMVTKLGRVYRGLQDLIRIRQMETPPNGKPTSTETQG